MDGTRQIESVAHEADDDRSGTPAGPPPVAQAFRLASSAGVSVELSNYGARILAVRCRDRDGNQADVVLGFDTIDRYEANASLYFGGTVGRVANRIAGAAFAIDGAAYRVTANEGRNHLHGGTSRSLDRVVWEANGPTAERSSVGFRYFSPHLEEGYPGNLAVSVTYSLVGDALRIDHVATTDRPTPVDLTNHAYWNLHGDGAGTILDHELFVAADGFAPADDELIPVGGVRSVDGGPLDFRRSRAIGERIGELRSGPTGGYDHTFVLDEPGLTRPAAILHDRCTGRVLELSTTQPALQLYTGNRIPSVRGKGGTTYGEFSGLCLEPEHIPDAIHRPEIPSIVLRPGETYSHTMIFRFRTDAA